MVLFDGTEFGSLVSIDPLRTRPTSHLPAPTFSSPTQHIFNVIKRAIYFSHLSNETIVIPQMTLMLTSRSTALIAVNSVLPFVAALTVVLRLYARTRRTLCLKSSDYTIVVAMVMLVAHRADPY